MINLMSIKKKLSSTQPSDERSPLMQTTKSTLIILMVDPGYQLLNAQFKLVPIHRDLQH